MMQTCVFQKERLIRKIKTNQQRKIGKQRNPNKKKICIEGVSENIMQRIPQETERK
jgi:hypothetical protein